MVYWLETMQDDSYLIVSDGWEVGTEVEYEKKEFEGKLIPKSILISRYFNDLKLEIENLEAERDIERERRVEAIYIYNLHVN